MSERITGVLADWEQSPVAPPVHGQRIERATVSVESRVVGDPEVALPSRQAIEEAREAAYRAGVADGHRAGVDAAVERSHELLASMLSSLDEVRAQLDLERRELLEGVADLALEMTTVVLGRTPHDDGAALADRIRDLVSSSAQTTTRVVVSAADAELVGAALSSIGLALEVSPELGPGEARVLGDWSSAAITVASMTATLRQAITDAVEVRPKPGAR
jgi:flagellar biosynthesis/type III secretory pathway protein FliH